MGSFLRFRGFNENFVSLIKKSLSLRAGFDGKKFVAARHLDITVQLNIALFRSGLLSSGLFLLLWFLSRLLNWSLLGFLDGILSLSSKCFGIGSAFSSDILFLFELTHHISDVASLHGFDLFLGLSDLISLLFGFTLFLLLLSDLSLLGIFFGLSSINYLLFLS